MTRLRISTLRRLVRVTELLYRQQAVQVAQLSQARAEISRLAASAEGFLDGDYAALATLPELAVARAARLRRLLVESDGSLEARIDIASGALAGFKGAESRLSAERARASQAANDRSLDEVIDFVVRRRQTSLE